MGGAGAARRRGQRLTCGNVSGTRWTRLARWGYPSASARGAGNDHADHVAGRGVQVAEDQSPPERAHEAYMEAKRWYDWLFVLCSHWPADTQPKPKAKAKAWAVPRSERDPEPLLLHLSAPHHLIEEATRRICTVCKRFSSLSATLATQRAFARSACPGSVAAQVAEVAGVPGVGRPHSLRLSGTLVWCQDCGRYAENRLRDLRQACPGPAGTGPTVGQPSRLKKGLHPLNGQPLGATTVLGKPVAGK